MIVSSLHFWFASIKFPVHQSSQLSTFIKGKMPFVKSKTYRERAIIALDRQLRLQKFDKPEESHTDGQTSSNKQFIDYYNEVRNQNVIERAKENAKKYLLFIRSLRENNGYYIPDQDRAVINEAIRAKLEPKHIELLLKDYPRACEAGGVVDHVDHPIHLACSTHRQVVPLILKASPECAKQRDASDRLPLELFLSANDYIDITSEEFTSTMNLLIDLNPTSARESFLRRSSCKNEVILANLPSHLKCALDLNSYDESKDSFASAARAKTKYNEVSK